MPACMAKNCNSGRAKEPWSFTRTRVVLYRFPKSARISNRWISFLMDCETEWRKILKFHENHYLDDRKRHFPVRQKSY